MTVGIAAGKEISVDAAGAAVLSTTTAMNGSSHSRKYSLYLRLAATRDAQPHSASLTCY